MGSLLILLKQSEFHDARSLSVLVIQASNVGALGLVLMLDVRVVVVCKTYSVVTKAWSKVDDGLSLLVVLMNKNPADDPGYSIVLKVSLLVTRSTPCCCSCLN